MRKLASIQKIIDLKPIPNADKIEVATILGWNCVVSKGDFKVGDYCVYFEIDSFLPVKPEFEFLRKNCFKKMADDSEGFRIRTIRLKKQISQGLALSTKILPQPKDYQIGEDVTELLGVKLWRPPIPACLKGLVKGSFPTFMPKSDETRVQVLQDVLTRHKGMKCYVTEKIDGTSATFYIKDGVFGVCSRNMELLETADNAYWKIARELKIEEKLKSLNTNIMLQGELCGEGIQGNPLKILGKKVLFFNAFEIDKYKYLNFEELFKLLKALNLDMVPVVNGEYILTDNIEELVKMSINKSVLNKNSEREGIVIRPVIEGIDLQMAQGFGNGRLSFKAVNPEYLLQDGVDE